jgi:adenosylcobinamide-phosphate synthase
MTARREKALCLALLLDLILGDPPNRFHPVAWMGSAIAAAKQHAPLPQRGHLAQLAYGALLSIGGSLAAMGLGRLIEETTAHLPAPLGWVADGLLLKMMLAQRGLATASEEVKSALDAGDLRKARRLVSWHLVSRDTTTLNESQVAAATVESVAENVSDGIIGPLFYYVLGGLPGALAYRFVNTADSMLGYRDPTHEWLGKVPARLDDLANLLPARLTALLLITGAALIGEDARRAWRIWRRDRNVTASPNAGHPMSVAAGALGVELEKVDHYRLGAGQHPPTPAHIGRAVRLMRVSVALAVGFLVGPSIVVRVFKPKASR